MLISIKLLAKYVIIIAPTGIHPKGEIPRRHPRALTVGSFTDYRLSSLERPSYLQDIRFRQFRLFILGRKLI